MKTFKHPAGYECVLRRSHYTQGGATALYLDGAPGTEYEGEPIGVVTVNIPNVRGTTLAADEVLVKDWSENKGMAAALEAAGIAQATGREIPTGFVTATVMKLNEDVLKEYVN